MAEKQMMQSGYGGTLSSRMRREVKSSAFGSSLRYLLELGSVCFDSEGCDGSVRPPSNFGARRLPLGPPCGLLDDFSSAAGCVAAPSAGCFLGSRGLWDRFGFE